MRINKCKSFGIEVHAAAAGSDLSDLDPALIREWVAANRLLILRDFVLKSDDDMLSICGRLGNVLQWGFGAINELKVKADAANYLYTSHAVPFHWDGAFVGRVPHLIFFHCVNAPAADSGGETTFCNTVDLLQAIPAAERDAWSNIRVTYSTEKVVHYGGSFTSPLIDSHTVSGEPVIRFAEPVDDLNPVNLMIDGLPENEHAAFLSRMQRLLYNPAYCIDHVWRPGDIVIADNHALLHGRRAVVESGDRHIRRVNVM
jgi:alpha-ketoglutarate-dependent taurine dioxygenase